MCCTTKMGTVKSAGSVGKNLLQGFWASVEIPTAMIAGAALRGVPCGLILSGAIAFSGDADLSFCAARISRDFDLSDEILADVDNIQRCWKQVAQAHNQKRPAPSAMNVVSASFSVTELTIMTGRGGGP